MIWKGLFLGEPSDHYYTVKELFVNIDPDLGKLNYVFDNFQWPHCEAEGYPLTLIGESTAEDDGNDWMAMGEDDEEEDDAEDDDEEEEE